MVIAAFWPVRRRKPPTAHPGPATNARVAPAPSPARPPPGERGPRGPRADDDERARPFLPERRPSARGVTPTPVATPGPPCLPSGGDQYPSRLPLSTSRHVTLDPPRTRASSPGANSDASNSTVALAPARPAPCVTLDPDPFVGGGSRGRPRVSLPAFPEACEPATPWPETTPCIDPVGPVSIRVVDEEASESRSESESTPMSSSSSSCGRS